MTNDIELRMYFFTIYQLSGIQAGIQCGHAALEYAHKYKDDPQFIDFIEDHKTWVILNGGTTNRNLGELGSLNLIALEFKEREIKFASFHEPDLENALTSICFLVDSRVFKFTPTADINDREAVKAEALQIMETEENFFIWEKIYDKPLARN
jgi:hypothetical protein